MTARAIVQEVQAVGGEACNAPLLCYVLCSCTKIGHFIFRLEKSLKLYSETKSSDLINMQNVK